MSKTLADELETGAEVYGFDAIRGVQAGREFYVAMCPMKIIPKLFRRLAIPFWLLVFRK